MIKYKENIPFPGHYYLLLLFIGISFYFVYISSLQLNQQVLSQNYGSLFFNLLMAFLFIAFIFVIYQFRSLDIVISDKEIAVSYGIFKRNISIDNIGEAYLDEANELWSYGGWGIRFGNVNGKKRMVYNLPAKGRVVLPLKDRNQEFVFSTRAPENILRTLKS